MRTRSRIVALILMTLLLGLVVAFLLYSSEDPRFGGGFWEEWLAGHFHWPQALVAQLVFDIRKALHFLGYGVVGLLFWAYFYLWRLPYPQFTGLLATAAVASLDEYTQSLTTFRSGKPADVGLDICGAVLVGILVRVVLLPKRSGKSEKR